MSTHDLPAHTDAQDAPSAPQMNQPRALTRRVALKGLLGAASAAVLFGLPTLAVAAEATQETLDALSDAEEEYEAVEAQLDELAAQFEELSVQQDETISEIEAVQAEIEAIEAEIEEKEVELEAQQEVLAARVASSYKADYDIFTILFSARSLDELISNAYYIAKLNERDQEVIAEVKQIQAELEASKAELESQMAALEALRETQTEQLASMQETQAEVQELLSDLSEEVEALIEQRDAEILAAAEAEAQAALEEAARQAAASSGLDYIPEVGSGEDYEAASDAQKRVVNACYVTPSPGAGYCAAWVSLVFSNAGFGYIGGNACDMYSSWCTSSNKSDLQVGMIVAVSSYSKSYSGRIWGHVGIYIGDDQIMDNTGSIAVNDLDTWLTYYGDTVSPRWGWASGIDLSAQ